MTHLDNLGRRDLHDLPVLTRPEMREWESRLRRAGEDWIVTLTPLAPPMGSTLDVDVYGWVVHCGNGDAFLLRDADTLDGHE